MRWLTGRPSPASGGRDFPAVFEAATVEDVYHAYSGLELGEESVLSCIGVSGQGVTPPPETPPQPPQVRRARGGNGCGVFVAGERGDARRRCCDDRARPRKPLPRVTFIRSVRMAPRRSSPSPKRSGPCYGRGLAALCLWSTWTPLTAKAPNSCALTPRPSRPLQGPTGACSGLRRVSQSPRPDSLLRITCEPRG